LAAISTAVIPGRRESGEPGIHQRADLSLTKTASVAYALQMPTIMRTDEFSNLLRTEMAKVKPFDAAEYLDSPR
jgi:hypothetical protein